MRRALLIISILFIISVNAQVTPYSNPYSYDDLDVVDNTRLVKGMNLVKTSVEQIFQSINNDNNLSNPEKRILMEKINIALNYLKTSSHLDLSTEKDVNFTLNYIKSYYNQGIEEINRLRKNNTKQSNFSDYLNKKFNVIFIGIYNMKGEIIRSEKIINDSYVMLTNDMLYYKNPNGDELFRDIKNVSFTNGLFLIESSYGDTVIDENFTFVRFYDKGNLDEYYEYTVSK